MSVTTIGRGNLSRALARLWGQGGHAVTCLGHDGGDATDADLALVAVPSDAITDALAKVRGLEGKITIGRRMRMTELGERVVLSRTRVSRIVGHMADAGMVEQDPDPEDGRAKVATLTPKGRDALRKAAPTYLAGIDTLFSAHLTSAQARTTVTALRKVLEPER